MAGKRKVDPAIVDSVFIEDDGKSETAYRTDAQIETVVTDKTGEVIAVGSPNEVKASMPTWVARVSQIHMTMKVTPQIKGVFVGVEKGMTIELNTFDPTIVDMIVTDLDDRIFSDVFNGLSRATKIIEESKKV